MTAQAQRADSAPGRNDPCACGSGRKFKHCCARTVGASAPGGVAQAEFRRGSVAERAGRLKEAITAYRVAALVLPQASSRLGHIFAGLGRRSEAVAAFRAAADGSPGDPDRGMDLVRALLLSGDDIAAEAQLRLVLERYPRNSDAQWLHGRILTEWGRFDEAAECYERSLSAAPDKAGAFYDLVRSRRLTKADQPLIDRMSATLRKAPLADERLKVHLAMAKALDDLDDHRGAMQQVIKATQVRKSLAIFDRDAMVRHVDALIERFTPEFLAARRRHGDASDLPVMIIGMPRSGTTLVEQILSSHSAVAGAGELHVWSGRDPLLNSAVSEKGLAESQAQTARACLDALRSVSPTADRVTDKNPFNFLSSGLIAAVFPRATIIHCRRHPIDTCLSIAFTYLAPRSDFPADLDDLVFYYRQYARLMAHWRAILPAETFVDIGYESLVADPEGAARRLVGAIGLPWDPACLSPHENKRTVKTNSAWQVRQPIYPTAVERWRRYEPWLGPLRQLAPD